MNLTKSLVCLSASLICSLTTFATMNSAADGDWNANATWNGDRRPTTVPVENLTIAHNLYLNEASDPLAIGQLFIGSSGTGSLVINAGGNLTTAATTVARNTAGSGNGTLTINGGTFNPTGLSIGTGATVSSSGFVVINSGSSITASGSVVLGNNTAGGQSGTITINGAGSAISFNTFTANRNGSLEFKLASTGGSQLNIIGTTTFNSGSEVIFDFQNYSGNVSTFSLGSLFGFGGSVTDNGATFSAINYGPLYSAVDITFNAATKSFTLVATPVPEPATYAVLLGLVVLTGVLLRRRQS